MSPKRLVLLVEGQGDVEAAPILVGRLLTEHAAFDAVFLDPHPFRVGEYSKITKNDFGEWRRYLKAAAKRRDFGGCILLLDGDSRAKVDNQPFCAVRAAIRLAAEAQKVGAGSAFSTAIVFACMEFESWLIAGVESLVDKLFMDGRKGLPGAISQVPCDPESAPRDAKGWFKKIIATGYKPARDQADLTRLVDLHAIRRHPKMRSFRRMEAAVNEMIAAIRSENHVATPRGGGG
jgi:hypothetical protein